MSDVVQGRDGARILPTEFVLYPQVMRRLDAIAAEPEIQEPCS